MRVTAKVTAKVIGRTAMILVVLAASAGIVGAEDVTAQKDAVLRRGKNSMTAIEARVTKGQILPILERAADGKVKWIRSQSEGKQGWVAESELKSSGGFSMGKMGSAISGSAQADAAGEAAAAKGVEPLTLAYAGGKGFDTSALDRLMELRSKIVDSGEFEKFSKEGNVGLYRK